jgi:integrase
VEESRKHRLCDKCRRPIVINQILSDETGHIRQELQPLADFLLSHHDKAESFHRWASRKNGPVDILREIARGASPLSADTIIKRASSYQSISFLLSMLAESGTLPDLDVQSARFESWLRDWLASISEPSERLILQQYASWGRTRPAHAVQGPRTSWYTRQRAALKHCAQLLKQVRTNGYSLDTFPQRELDAFLSGSATQQDALAKFTQWLTEQRISRLRVPHRNHQLAGYGYESDKRWHMARRLLRETDLAPVDRVGGLLVLLYGLPVTRIVALARSDVQVMGDRVTLTIGKDPIEMPEPLGQAMRDLLTQNERRSDRWLFAGRNPGRPLSPGALGKRLRLLGMEPGDARVTALFELAQQMHPRILSDLFGISITTATAWWRLAAGDWISYPSLR